MVCFLRTNITTKSNLHNISGSLLPADCFQVSTVLLEGFCLPDLAWPLGWISESLPCILDNPNAKHTWVQTIGKLPEESLWYYPWQYFPQEQWPWIWNRVVLNLTLHHSRLAQLLEKPRPHQFTSISELSCQLTIQRTHILPLFGQVGTVLSLKACQKHLRFELRFDFSKNTLLSPVTIAPFKAAHLRDWRTGGWNELLPPPWDTSL